MTTITISLAGSAIMANAQKAYTISDADLQSLLNWAAAVNASSLPASPSNAQILLAWVQNTLVNPTIGAVQSFQRTAPPPISIS